MTSGWLSLGTSEFQLLETVLEFRKSPIIQGSDRVWTLSRRDLVRNGLHQLLFLTNALLLPLSLCPCSRKIFESENQSRHLDNDPPSGPLDV